MGLELRSRGEDRVRRRPWPAQRRSVSHRLHGPAGQTPIRPNIFDISNAAAATIDGVEAEVDHRGWPQTSQAGAHLAWLDATYDQYLAPAGSALVDVAGHRLNNTPEWSGRLWIEMDPHHRWREFVVAARGNVTGENYGVFHPLQLRSAAIAVGIAGTSAPSSAPPSALVRGCVRAQPHQLEDDITGSFGTPAAIGGRPAMSASSVQLGIGC